MKFPSLQCDMGNRHEHIWFAFVRHEEIGIDGGEKGKAFLYANY